MNRDTFKSLVKVLHYLATDEERDWEASGKPDNHIYNDIERLMGWADANRPTQKHICDCGNEHEIDIEDIVCGVCGRDDHETEDCQHSN